MAAPTDSTAICAAGAPIQPPLAIVLGGLAHRSTGGVWLSPGDDWVLVSDHVGRFVVQSPGTGEPLCRLEGVVAQDRSTLVSSDDGKRLLVVLEEELVLYEMPAARLIRRLPIRASNFYQPTLSRSGDRALFTTLDELVIADLRAGTTRTIEVGSHEAVALSPAGDSIALLGRSSLDLIDASSGNRRTLTTVAPGVLTPTVRWTPDSRSLALVIGGAVHVVDVASGQRTELPRPPVEPGETYMDDTGVAAYAVPIAFSADGSRLAASLDHWRAHVWDLRARTLLHGVSFADSAPLLGIQRESESLALSADGRTLVNEREKCWARFEVATGALAQGPTGACGWPEEMMASSDGRVLLLRMQGGEVWAWSRTDGTTRRLDAGVEARVAALSPDGTRAALAGFRGEQQGVWLIGVGTGTPTPLAPLPTDPVGAMAFDVSGNRVVVATRRQAAWFDASTGAAVSRPVSWTRPLEIDDDPGPVPSYHWSNGATHLVEQFQTESETRNPDRVRIFDTATGALVAQDQTERCQVATRSPRLLCRRRVLEIQPDGVEARLLPATRDLSRSSLSSDGRHVITRARGSTSVEELDTGRVVARFGESIGGITVLLDPTHIAAAGSNGSVWIWEGTP